MRRWRFALGGRWFGYLAFAILFALACVLLSQWQFARRDEAVAAITKVQENYDAVAVPLEEALADTSAFDDSQEWTPVTISGTYLIDEQLLVRSRPFGGRPGFEVLTPLLIDDGNIFIVNRGWVPTGNEQDSPDFVPAPPTLSKWKRVSSRERQTFEAAVRPRDKSRLSTCQRSQPSSVTRSTPAPMDNSSPNRQRLWMLGRQPR